MLQLGIQKLFSSVSSKQRFEEEAGEATPLEFTQFLT